MNDCVCGRPSSTPAETLAWSKKIDFQPTLTRPTRKIFIEPKTYKASLKQRQAALA